MKTIVSLVALVSLAGVSFATTLTVDKNGGGQFTSIQPAIDAANANDTVKVWPSTYVEQVNLNKNITLMGSGYESTIITGDYDATVTMSSGRMQWFMISSTRNNGVLISGGTLRNCVVRGCQANGIVSTTGASAIMNCISLNNNGYGIYANGGTLNITNCISRANTLCGFARNTWAGGAINLSYSNGCEANTTGNQGSIDQDPLFASSDDFHISAGSPCWDTGQPSLTDPDGSRSDMGYFGGPDCPIYPVVTQIIISPSGNTINLTAKARANY